MIEKGLLEKQKELYFKKLQVPEELKPGYELCIEAHKYWIEGKVLDTIRLMEEALEFFQKFNALKEVANILDFLGDIYHSRGNVDKALKCYRSCLDVCESAEDEFSVAILCDKIIHIYRTKGEYEKMLPYLYRNLEIAEKFKDAHRAARSLVGIGDVYRIKKKWDASKEAYELAYKIYKNMGAKELAEKAKLGLEMLEKEREENQKIP